MMQNLIFKGECIDQPGIVAEISHFFLNNGFNILTSAQHSEVCIASGEKNKTQNRFFLRLECQANKDIFNLDLMIKNFTSIAKNFNLKFSFKPKTQKMKVWVMVSKVEHCLQRILYAHRINELPFEIVGVSGNHIELQEMVSWYGIPFHHIPVNSENKKQSEEKLQNLLVAHEVELVVLARYMQILSEEFCQKWFKKCINIHHSFLPSFKGARPYHQAFKRGVKFIGATAHYITTELDEGPIINQDVQKVTYKDNIKTFIRKGRFLETEVLLDAIRYHTEHRIFLNAHKSIIL